MSIERVLKLIKISKNAYAEFSGFGASQEAQQMGDIIPRGYVRYIWFAYFNALDAHFTTDTEDRRLDLTLAGNDPFSVDWYYKIAHFKVKSFDLTDIHGGDIESPVYVVRPDYSDMNDPKNKVYAIEYYGNEIDAKVGLLITYYDLKE